MMSEILFSYGTLQKEKVQQELFGRTLTGKKDSLRSYQLATIEINDEEVLSKSEQRYLLIAILSGNENDVIEGVAFEMSTEEIRRADDYETEDYTRVKVILESGRESWVYVSSSHASTSSA